MGIKKHYIPLSEVRKSLEIQSKVNVSKRAVRFMRNKMEQWVKCGTKRILSKSRDTVNNSKELIDEVNKCIIKDVERLNL